MLFGARGQLGREIQQIASSAGFAVAALGRDQADIADPESVRRAFTPVPQIVINAAAYTAVDRAESEPELAFKVNSDGPANVAAACSEFGVPLIHISTDYVFDGSEHGPWKEDDPTSPLSVYGASKLAGEIAVRSLIDHHVIIRTAWVYAWHGQNFVRTMLRVGAERDEVRVVNDQTGCPTSATDLAEACLAVADGLLCNNPRWGTYHYCGRGETTWYGFAQEIFRQSETYGRVGPRVVPIATSDYPTAASRPMNSVLDCSRIEKDYGVGRPRWQTSLQRVVAALCGPGA